MSPPFNEKEQPVAPATRGLSWTLTAALAFSLSACARYHAAPIDPAAHVAATASRQLPARPSWSASDLLAEAINSSAALRAKADAYRSAVAAANSARIPLPAAFQLTAEYSHQDNPNKPWLGSGVFDFPVDLGGRRNARVREADLAVAQARLDYLDALWTARSAIRHAMISRLAADEALPLAIRARDLRTDRLRRLDRRVAAGEDPRSIVLAARIESAAAERRLEEIEANSREATLSLANQLGIDPRQIEHLPLERPAAFRPDEMDIPRLREAAALGRSDVLRAIVDYDRAETDMRLEIASQYPAIRIQPGYTYERGIVKLPLGVNLQLPPIDGNKAAIRAAEKRRQEAGTKLEAAQDAVLAGVDRTHAALDAALGAEMLRAKQDVPMAHSLARAASAALERGETDRVDEEAAVAAALETDLDRIDASRVAAFAVIDLEDALRHTGDPEEAKLFARALGQLGDIE